MSHYLCYAFFGGEGGHSASLELWGRSILWSAGSGCPNCIQKGQDCHICQVSGPASLLPHSVSSNAVSTCSRLDSRLIGVLKRRLYVMTLHGLGSVTFRDLCITWFLQLMLSVKVFEFPTRS